MFRVRLRNPLVELSPQRVITTAAYFPVTMYASDLDNDDDTEVQSALCAHKIAGLRVCRMSTALSAHAWNQFFFPLCMDRLFGANQRRRNRKMEAFFSEGDGEDPGYVNVRDAKDGFCAMVAPIPNCCSLDSRHTRIPISCEKRKTTSLKGSGKCTLAAHFWTVDMRSARQEMKGLISMLT